MEIFCQITSTTALLLLILTVHPVQLQNNTEATDAPELSTTEVPTNSGGKTIPAHWNRRRDRLPPKNTVVQPYESSVDDQNGIQPPEAESGSSYDQSGSGNAFGSMLFEEATEDSTQVSMLPNETMLEPQNHQDSNSSMAGGSVTDADTRNNETVLENVDEFPKDFTNGTNVTEVQTAIPALGKNVTDVNDVGSGGGNANKTENTTTTVIKETTDLQSSTTSSTTLAAPVPETTSQESTERSIMTEASTTGLPETEETTTSVPETTDRANQSDKGASPAERGFGSESERRERKNQWGAVVGTSVAVAVVVIIAYVIIRKKKHHKVFSHRKLEEDFPSDPVLRLDNSEPLDLNFGRAAYTNRGLQMDNIQMSPYPKN